MIDQLFVLTSVIIAFTAWKCNREYFLISMILVADFALFFGFDEILIRTDYIDLNQYEVSFVKGFIYLAFYYLYLIGGSIWLAALSFIAAMYHIVDPSSSVEEYGLVMSVYCIMQLLIAWLGTRGVTYDSVRKHLPHFLSFVDYFHRFKDKTQ